MGRGNYGGTCDGPLQSIVTMQCCGVYVAYLHVSDDRFVF